MKRQNVEKSKRQHGERRKRPWLRRLGVVVGCLFAGAIINVLVAWGIALLVEKAYVRSLNVCTSFAANAPAPDSRNNGTLIWSAPGVSRIQVIHDCRGGTADVDDLYFEDLVSEWWEDDRDANSHLDDAQYYGLYHGMPIQLAEYGDRCEYLTAAYLFSKFTLLDRGQEVSPGPASFPYWYQLRLGYDAADGAYWAMQLTDASGWPFRAMVCEVRLSPIARREPHYQHDIQDGIPLTDTQRLWNLRGPPTFGDAGLWTSWRAFPLRPIWPGFLINSLIYGAIVWMLFAAPRAVRRHRRSKRRQCPACGYPVGTSAVCTECGVAVKRLTTSVD